MIVERMLCGLEVEQWIDCKVNGGNSPLCNSESFRDIIGEAR